MDAHQMVMELLRRVAAGDPEDIAELYADEVAWNLDWPAGLTGAPSRGSDTGRLVQGSPSTSASSPNTTLPN